MNGPSSARGFRQPRCPGCGLTPQGCVCGLFPPLQCPVAVSVVMSPPEARSASNSARLLALWLPGVQLHVRGAEHGLEQPAALIARPGTALLFPGGGRAAPLPSSVEHLIVPDGTWAQARRIERQWFARHGLPKVELEGPWPSVYALRRGREGLCTFEATAIALGALGQPALAAQLLDRFAEWAERARLLKAGGGQSMPPGALRRHPAGDLLRALPPGSTDAGRARERAAGARSP
jgi:tRNA-uridine aminocarboxypropyltransferase